MKLKKIKLIDLVKLKISDERDPTNWGHFRKYDLLISILRRRPLGAFVVVENQVVDGRQRIRTVKEALASWNYLFCNKSFTVHAPPCFPPPMPLKNIFKKSDLNNFLRENEMVNDQFLQEAEDLRSAFLETEVPVYFLQESDVDWHDQ